MGPVKLETKMDPVELEDDDVKPIKLEADDTDETKAIKLEAEDVKSDDVPCAEIRCPNCKHVFSFEDKPRQDSATTSDLELPLNGAVDQSHQRTNGKQDSTMQYSMEDLSLLEQNRAPPDKVLFDLSLATQTSLKKTVGGRVAKTPSPTKKKDQGRLSSLQKKLKTGGKAVTKPLPPRALAE